MHIQEQIAISNSLSFHNDVIDDTTSGTLAYEVKSLKMTLTSFKYFDYTYNSATIDANGNEKVFNATNTILSGYSAIGILRISSSTANVFPRAFNAVNGQIVFGNSNSTQKTITPEFKVIIAKITFSN